MSAPRQWTAVRRTFACALPFAIAAWLTSVPPLVGTSIVVAAVGSCWAISWLVYATHRRGMPAPSRVQGASRP